MALGFGEGGGEVVARARAVLSADTGGLTRGLKDAEQQTHRSGKIIGDTLKGAGIAAAAGIGLATVAVGESIKAAADYQVVNQRLITATKNAGVSWKQYGGHIEDTLTKMSETSGFMKADLADSFGKIVTATGNAGESTDLLGLSMDLARARSIPLSNASVILSKVWNGNTTSLVRLGISLPKVTTAQDKLKASGQKVTTQQEDQAKKTDKLHGRTEALRALMQKFGGQSASYAKTARGEWDKFHSDLDDLEIQIGRKFLPALSTLTGSLTKIFDAKSWKARVGIVFAGGESAAKSVYDSITKALFGYTNTHPIRLPTGRVVGMESDSHQGIVDSIEKGLKTTNWAHVASVILNGLATALSKGSNLAGKLANGFVSLFMKIPWYTLGEQGAGAFIQFVAGAITAITSPSFWLKHWEDIVTILITVFPVDSVAEMLGLKFIRVFTKPLADVERFVGRWIKVGFQDTFDSGIGSAVKSATDALGKLPGKFKNILEGVLVDVGRWVGSFADTMVGGIKKTAQGTLKDAGDLASGIMSPFKGIGHFFSNLWGGVKGIFSTDWRSIVNTADGWINKLLSPYNWIAGKLSLPRLELPTKLATGGIVPATPGGVYLPHLHAVVGEGGYDEAILSTDPKHRKRTYSLISEVVRRINSGGTHGQEILPDQGITRAFSLGGVASSAWDAITDPGGWFTSHMPGLPHIGGEAGALVGGLGHRLEKAMLGFIFGSGGGTSVAKAAREAQRMASLHRPYLWGGGHGGYTPSGPWDCSGGVSQVLHVAGLLPGAPETSGTLMGWGSPGEGVIDIQAGPEHVFMSIAGHGFGTSDSNPGGGWGALGYNVPLSSGFPGSSTIRHSAGANRANAIAIGRRRAAAGGILNFSGGVPPSKVMASWGFKPSGRIEHREKAAIAEALRQRHKALSKAKTAKQRQAAYEAYNRAVAHAKAARRGHVRSAGEAYYQSSQTSAGNWINLEQSSQDPHQDATLSAMYKRQLGFIKGGLAWARRHGFTESQWLWDARNLENTIAGQQQQQQQAGAAELGAFLQQQQSFLNEFGGNIVLPGASAVLSGSSSASAGGSSGGGPTVPNRYLPPGSGPSAGVTIHNHFTQTPPDSFVHIRKAKLQAEAAWS